VKLPRRLDWWLARYAPNLYAVLWYWHLVRNEPPASSLPALPQLASWHTSHRVSPARIGQLAS
jgi:hypothetical protein